MRFSTVQTSIGLQPLGRNNQIQATYRAFTTNATATELFIDASANRRLVPDPASGGLIRVLAVGYNVTDNVALSAETFVAFQTSAAGVITLVDQDGVTGGSQDNVLSSVTTAGTRAGALGVTVSADNGVQFDVVAASGTFGTAAYTPAFIRCQVRGAANKTVSWEVFVDCLEATATGA